MPTPTEQGIYYFAKCLAGTAEWHGPCSFNETHAREAGVPLEHMTETHCKTLLEKWSRPITGWKYRLHKELADTLPAKKTAKVAALRVERVEEPSPPKLQTWGSVHLDGKIADHLLTVQRIKDAGYTFTYKPHPDVSTRSQYYQYELYVIFNLYDLGTYKPA